MLLVSRAWAQANEASAPPGVTEPDEPTPVQSEQTPDTPQPDESEPGTDVDQGAPVPAPAAPAEDPEPISTPPAPAPGTADGSTPGRPSEDELFARPAQSDEAPLEAERSGRPSENAIFGAPRSVDDAPARRDEVSPETDDYLQIGGMMYLRALANGLEGQRVSDYAFRAPSVLDVYFDARPSDRVRGFALGRLLFDATTADTSDQGVDISGSQEAATVSASDSGTVAAIDQLWIKFDVERTVFVTAGKQHVRWGTGHFWMPTDFMHQENRDPLSLFDTRTGTSMLKLHLPIESTSSNFYLYSIMENQEGDFSLDEIAGAARAEVVLGTSELAAGAFWRKDESPKFAADFSMGFYGFDAYGEVAVTNGRLSDRVRYEPEATIPDPVAPPSWQSPDEAIFARLQQVSELVYPSYRRHGYRPQVVGGLTYQLEYRDSDHVTVGAEYFYNGAGYPNADPYLGFALPRTVALTDPAVPYYLGEHYGALFVSVPAPFSLNLHSFTLSTLANFSDQSFVTRLDYTLSVLTYLGFEAFVAARYGDPAGEFRFGLNSIRVGEFVFDQPPAIVDVGFALRLTI